jgi:5S rRNA maturation endonuclease (ribonuclease M5)
VAVYDYADERGRLLYQQCRTEPKSFFTRRPDGSGGFVNGLNGARRVPYRLRDLIEADPVLTLFVVEGEKDADRLRSLGLLATTNAGGAGKWRDEYSEPLRDRSVVILPDNDEPGRKHAAQVARSLKGIAASVKVVELPNLPGKGDVSDWLDAGGSVGLLHELAAAAQEVEPSREEEQQGEASLLAIARSAELFHTPFGDTYTTFKSPNGHSQTCAIESQEFRHWLTYMFWRSEKRAPRKEELSAAINAAQGLARYEGEQRTAFTRLAAHNGDFYLDLCDEQRRVVKISCDGWRIISAEDAPVRFRRPRGMLALPLPVAGGDVTALRLFVNVANDEDFILLLAWLVASLRGDATKFPVLSLTGEQGSAKSTVSSMLRSLIDPNVVPLRNSVRNQWDATIAATNSWCVALNNLSELPQWLSDTLCCIADGIGFAARTHHTMNEETLFQATRPIIINGITDIATRADLLDRAVCLHLPSIPKEKRLDDAALLTEFEQARPLILGGLLTGVCAAMRNLPHVRLRKLPRMADFAKWATASEGGLGLDAGAFMTAYSRNRNAASDAALEASPVAAALISYVRQQGEITMSLQTLLTTLAAQFGDGKAPSDFPKSTQKLSAELRRCAPHLRAAGLSMADAGREGGKGSKMTTFALAE